MYILKYRCNICKKHFTVQSTICANPATVIAEFGTRALHDEGCKEGHVGVGELLGAYPYLPEPTIEPETPPQEQIREDLKKALGSEDKGTLTDRQQEVDEKVKALQATMPAATQPRKIPQQAGPPAMQGMVEDSDVDPGTLVE